MICRRRDPRRTAVPGARLAAARSTGLAAAATVAMVVGACARTQTYRASSVGDQSATSATASLAAYRARRLDDPGLGRQRRDWRFRRFLFAELELYHFPDRLLRTLDIESTPFLFFFFRDIAIVLRRYLHDDM